MLPTNGTLLHIRTSGEAPAPQGKPPLMLPPRKCAEALGLSEYTVRQWLKTGFVKSVPSGRKQLINVDSLRRRLEEL